MTYTGGAATYNHETYQNELLDFNYKTEISSGSWPIMAVRAKDANSPIYSGSNEGYLVVVKQNTIELQRFKGSDQHYFYQDTPNTVFTSNAVHHVQFGAINVGADAVRLIFTVDGQKVFDYLDTDANRIMAPGYFQMAQVDKPATLLNSFQDFNQSSAKDILAVSLVQSSRQVIDSGKHTITLFVNPGTNVTTLAPTFTLSDGSTIMPNSATAHDFTDPVTYKVQAQDGTQQEWVVTVIKDAVNQAVGKRLLVSNENNGASYGRHKAIDGDSNTVWAPSGLTNQWLTVDFGIAAKLNAVMIEEGGDTAWLQDYVLQSSEDGTNWNDIDGTHVSNGNQHEGIATKTLAFGTISTKMVRLKINQAVGVDFYP